MSLVYVAGSMRERPRILMVSDRLTRAGFDVFNDWIMPGEQTDEKWQEFEQAQGKTYLQAIEGPHAADVFEFDKAYLDQSDAFVLVYPAGKSGHTELGYMCGSGKPSFILLDAEPARWDVMLKFADGITLDLEELVEMLKHSVAVGLASHSDVGRETVEDGWKDGRMSFNEGWAKNFSDKPIDPKAAITSGWSSGWVEPHDCRSHPCPDPGQEPLGEIDQILADRDKLYGNYADVSFYSQEIKRLIRKAEEDRVLMARPRLTDPQRESLHMIANKIARILGGDADYEDSWTDIAGYAKLHKGHHIK